MKEKLSLVFEFLSQAIDVLSECITAQEKKIKDLREIHYASIQLTLSIDFLSCLRNFQRETKSIRKSVEKELENNANL